MTASKRLNLSVQYASSKAGLPLRPQIRAWVRAALDVDGPHGGQITVRFVGEEEGRTLNQQYRGKNHATNVLSFPYDQGPVICGDLVICAPVVEREAVQQDKLAEAHFAHLVVHGLLHLQGHDHEKGARKARLMEDRERIVLASLGFSDPYPEEN